MSPKRSLSPPNSSPPKPISKLSTKMPKQIPPFLSLPLYTLTQKHAKIDAYERHLRSLPNATHSHPIAHARDRYAEIKPWTHNTLSLHSLSFPYINASWINLGRNDERFIATQGPLSDVVASDSYEHFWEMAWQEESEIVVMLTGAEEAGKEKCGVYYPVGVGDVKILNEWGDVECVSKLVESGTEVRELRLKKRVGGKDEGFEERRVWHFLFLAWPDHGVPKSKADIKALLKLIKMTRFRIDDAGEGRAKSLAPRMVHCSAGVGRTGTFIALDHLLQELKDGAWEALENKPSVNGDLSKDESSVKIQEVASDAIGESDEGEEEWGENTEGVKDPVFETVIKLREQRVGMVYQPGQYAFIYRVLREKWEAKHQLAVNMPTAEEVVGETLESPPKKRKLSLAENSPSQGPNSTD